MTDAEWLALMQYPARKIDNEFYYLDTRIHGFAGAGE